MVDWRKEARIAQEQVARAVAENEGLMAIAESSDEEAPATGAAPLPYTRQRLSAPNLVNPEPKTVLLYSHIPRMQLAAVQSVVKRAMSIIFVQSPIDCHEWAWCQPACMCSQ